MDTVGGPLLCCYLTGNRHIATMYTLDRLRLWQTVDDHSGYDFPGPSTTSSHCEHHDFHHMALTNNHFISFRYLDFIFGADNKYRADRKRVTNEKAKARAAAKKELSKAESDAIKTKLRAETEVEGILPEQAAEKGDRNATQFKSKTQ